MRIRHLSITVIGLSLAACGGGAEDAVVPAEAQEQAVAAAEQEVAGPERRILAFGDSLFAGYGLDEQQGYPEQLEDTLRARGTNARVIDAGVSGDTSAAGRQRLAFTLDAQDTPPDLVILELGGNDMLRGIQPDQTRANFAAMLEELRARQIPVLLMGMRAPPNYGTEYQRQFDALYADLAQEYGTALVPFWLESIYQDPALFLDDRIHPTAAGIAALVEDTVDDVERVLPQE
ncbi:MAG TPA: arylesterase [Erythrobacter sp.]|jgi:acyl-CoA thioesterase I|uniref:Acyl-CoA thioesterase-1 n=2 Tax=Qipengyuania citrea TaxID=225971 RepID=A0A6I4U8M5_9SPHN|nr:arylesterase [Qipengyuania citrea]KNH02307.1 Arylesterase precursor [Qipengyuania citrea LAMA 915]MDQ0565732.1 acyl-CoA thioesterase-1 [Qipengyuania citrea]MXP35262.1 arylesterase [Qipengyuania citrea]HCJ21609.1 arylesterase [Erythrobacter sp.]|tara:strand:- start:4417 stop:5115 length:699 start_codon:yes stop_codon:yes gene_type:complete